MSPNVRAIERALTRVNAGESVDCPVCLRRGVQTDTCPGHEGELIAYTADELQALTFPPRKALICRNTQDGPQAILRAGDILEVYGYRGFGKTWLVLTFALIGGDGGEALGLHAPERARVLYVDGEMASEDIQARSVRMRNMLHLSGPSNVTFIGADWQTDYLPRSDSPEGQAHLESFIAQNDIVIFDNRSALCDPEGEKDPVAWQPMQDYLLSLRRRGKAVIIVHHANRQGGARGIGKPEDVMNTLLKISRPEGYTQDQGARFLLEFDKARAIHGPAAAPMVCQLTDDGWIVEGSNQSDSASVRLLEYVRACAGVGEYPKSASAAVKGAGIKKVDGLKAWKTLINSGAIKQHVNGDFYVP